MMQNEKTCLELFVDGLEQEVINGEDFTRLMPSTYAFLKKVQYVQMLLAVRNGHFQV